MLCFTLHGKFWFVVYKENNRFICAYVNENYTYYQFKLTSIVCRIAVFTSFFHFVPYIFQLFSFPLTHNIRTKHTRKRSKKKMMEQKRVVSLVVSIDLFIEFGKSMNRWKIASKCLLVYSIYCFVTIFFFFIYFCYKIFESWIDIWFYFLFWNEKSSSTSIEWSAHIHSSDEISNAIKKNNRNILMVNVMCTHDIQFIYSVLNHVYWWMSLWNNRYLYFCCMHIYVCVRVLAFEWECSYVRMWTERENI